MVLGDASSKLQTFVWIFNHVLKYATWSLLDLKHETRTDGQSQRYPPRNGVNSSTGSNLKLAPVSCAIPNGLLPQLNLLKFYHLNGSHTHTALSFLSLFASSQAFAGDLLGFMYVIITYIIFNNNNNNNNS